MASTAAGAGAEVAAPSTGPRQRSMLAGVAEKPPNKRALQVASTGPIQRAISVALDSNLALQAALRRRLAEARSAQVRNRRDHAGVAASLARCRDDAGGRDGGASDDDEAGAAGEERDRAGGEEGGAAGPAGGAPGGPARLLESRPRMLRHPNRRKARGFFVDRYGSTPELSRKDRVDENGSGTSMSETNGSRSLRGEPQKTCAEVALGLKHARFSFAPSGMPKAKFTKQESLSLLSMVGNSGGDVDWHDVGAKHFAVFKRQTPWLCFRHYRSSLQNPASRCPPWSPDEDELLLKYIAAQGPQFLLQGEALARMCRSLFPRRSPKQLAVRAQSTLVNPSYVHDAWSVGEKRRLALLMRAYSNEPRALRCAARAAHFPRRAPKSVTEQWAKRLDPTLSRLPFSAAEDGELRGAPRPWAVGETLSKRSRDSLKRRFDEIADEAAVAKECENRLIKKAFAMNSASLLDTKDFLVLPQSRVSQPTRQRAAKEPDTGNNDSPADSVCKIGTDTGAQT